MITLGRYLYESLLDDEDDLVDDNTGIVVGWADKFGIEVVDKLPKLDVIKSCIRIAPGDNIESNYLSIPTKLQFKLSELFDPGLSFKKLNKVMLKHPGGAKGDVIDLVDPSQYRYIPSCVKQLCINLFNVNNAFELDFTKLDNISKLSDLYLRLKDTSNDLSHNIPHLPHKHLRTLEISSRFGAVNLDSISDIDCDKLILENFTNNKQSILFINPGYRGIEITEPTEFARVYENFMKRNKVKQLLIVDAENNYYGFIFDDEASAMYDNRLHYYKSHKVRYNKIRWI